VFFVAEDLRGGETTIGDYISIAVILILSLFVSSLFLVIYFLSGDNFIAFETLLFIESTN
jgi:hypothetical protein